MVKGVSEVASILHPLSHLFEIRLALGLHRGVFVCALFRGIHHHQILCLDCCYG